MCGIWARTRFGQAVDPAELLHPVAQLAHRGPDGYGWYLDDRAALVHTRLSIVDLEGGAQPLATPDGRWIGIVNGELYDYEAIRADLERDGAAFRTRSDSEVLLNLFALRGPDALAGVSGEFAFVFYDRHRRKLHFGRDPYGVKPLFMERRDDGFTLASEMKALQDEPPAFDPAYVKAFLARAIAPPRTALLGVEHVWPGRAYALDLRTRALEQRAYAPPPFAQARELGGQAAAELLQHELRASVRRRLKADVEVGCYLSGGVDSALIAALATEAGASPRAFTVAFADRRFDESEEAGEIARELGLRHSIVTLTSDNFMASLMRSIRAFENPIVNPHGAAKNLLSHLASQSVKVVLSGEGADECFGGYAYFRIRKLNEFIARHPRLGRGARAAFLAREGKINARHLDGDSAAFDDLAAPYFGGHAPAILGRIPRRGWYRYLTGEPLDALVRDLCESLGGRWRQETPAGVASAWDLDSWVALRTDLLHYVLANVGDRQEMAHSLEGRTPFLDPRVVAAASRIRPDALLRGLTEKHVIRRVAARHLSARHCRRGKRPFFAPMKYFFLKANQPIIDDCIESAKAALPGLHWAGIDHLLARGVSPASPLNGDVTSLKITLFSLGVLARQLRDPLLPSPRGYAVPSRVEDLMYRRVGDERSP